MMKELTQNLKTSRILTILFTILSIHLLEGQISKGGIMIIGFDADGTDHITLAVLESIPNGEIIYITDNEWNGTGWNGTGEGELTWTNNTGSEIAAGTIIEIDASTPAFIEAGFGTLTEGSGSFALSTSGDDIFIFQGSGPESVPTSFITAFSSGPDGTNTLSGTGLTNGIDAIDNNQFTDDDVILYTGSLDCSGGDLVACSTMLATSANYSVEDASGDQSEDGNFPDIPDDNPDDFEFDPPILPIVLNKFEAHLNKSNSVDIIWQTAIEINNDYVVIEHKSNSTKEFEELVLLKGEGNSYKPKDYKWTHKTPDQGVNYYRLVQYDLNGDKEIHPIVFVDVPSILHVYPTYVKDNLVIEFDTEYQKTSEIRIYGRNGDLKDSVKAENEKAINIDCSSYLTGFYNVQVLTDKQISNFRIIKM